MYCNNFDSSTVLIKYTLQAAGENPCGGIWRTREKASPNIE
jgi:hypothetical protein